MDLLTPIAFGFAVLAVAVADLLDGGSLRGLVNVPAMVLVLGGTLGATLMSTPAADLYTVPKFLRRLLRPSRTPVDRTAEDIVALAEIARREGLLRLEDELRQRPLAPFLQRGLQLVVDGAGEERLRLLLTEDIDIYAAREQAGARFFATAGGYAPTLGIIGTVVGLVSVLANLSDVPKLAPSIATAFIATLWGISSANFFWLPIAYKIRSGLREELRAREMIVQGAAAIAAGRNPRLVAEELAAYRLRELAAPRGSAAPPGPTGEKA